MRSTPLSWATCLVTILIDLVPRPYDAHPSIADGCLAHCVTAWRHTAKGLAPDPDPNAAAPARTVDLHVLQVQRT
ncbi:hypothetical protein [Streptomyces niveus]|uniref:hypothetical protein n=1 Tax=Streptomyces niveus TaxID=193462 RepID=UPI003651E0DF